MARRTQVAAAVVMLGIPMLVLAGAPSAWACSCVPMGFDAQVARADVIFSGRVVERSDGFLGIGSASTRWTLNAATVYKGRAQEQQEVATASSEASCGYEFVVGESYLVLAQRPKESDLGLDTNFCSGTRPTGQEPVPDSLGPGTEPAGAVDGEAMPAGQAVAIGVGVAGGVALVLWGLTIVRRRGRSSP